MNNQNDRQNQDPLICEECGKEYSPHWDTCPHCRAAEKAAKINKRGNYQSPLSIVVTVVFALVLVAGGVGIYQIAAEDGGWTIGREYAAAEEKLQTVQAGITEQQSQLDSVQNAVVPDTTTRQDTDEESDVEADETDETDETFEE